MKKLVILMLPLCTGLLLFSGCGDETKTSKTVPGKSTPSSAKASFQLSVPLLSTTVKQGETKAASIGIKRDKDFDQDVTLSFDNLPKGVTIDPERPVIKHGYEEAKVMVKAADDAALGDFTVKAMGHPAKGEDASKDLKLTVAKK